jgi:hypothetical protein
MAAIPDIGAHESQESAMATKKTAPFSLTVTAAPDFFPGISPAELSVVKGVVAVYNVTFTGVGGFTGPITLAVLNLPTGAVASFDKPSINVSEKSVLSIATAGAALGTFALSLEGTANV